MAQTDVAFAGIADQLRMLSSGELTSRSLLELYLQRIERLNPVLNAFRVVFAERARMEADQADARRRAGAERPLLGIPIAVKDDIDVEGEITGLGSNAYGDPASHDAEVVSRLRAAGAVIIGKTNVPELCMFPFTESAARGYTRNPWDLNRTPGGSSGGTGAAVAAGLASAGIGSDGGGSIRIPAAYCGLFGLKPQRGRVPLAPHLDAWHGLSVNGFLTRTVLDTALLLDAISDGQQDPGAPEPDEQSYTAAATERPGPLRVAVIMNLPPSPLSRLHEENRAAVHQTAELLQTLGHQVTEVQIEHGPLVPGPEFVLRYFRGIHDEAAAMAHPERLERRTRAMAAVGGLIPDGAVAWARKSEAALEARYQQAFAEHDLLLTPVTPKPAPKIGSCEGRGWLWTSTVSAATVPYCVPWNVTGLPACSIPAGAAADGMPRAVQLVGPYAREGALLALAAEIEAHRPWAQRHPALAA